MGFGVEGLRLVFENVECWWKDLVETRDIVGQDSQCRFSGLMIKNERHVANGKGVYGFGVVFCDAGVKKWPKPGTLFDAMISKTRVSVFLRESVVRHVANAYGLKE